MVHTVTFNQAMLAKDRVFAIRTGAYTSSDIKEASFNYGYISGDTFKPGGTVAGSAKLTFTSIITSFNKLDKVYPEIGLKAGDSFEWVAMGEYFVNDINIDRNRNTTELDLMDGMFKLNQPYISDLIYPVQIRDVIREICVKTGVELETDNLGFRAIQHHIQSKADKKDITFREVLSQAIQLLGFSAFFNRKGKLEIRGLTESNITITADNYFLHGLTKSELMYQIAGITCKKDKETLTVGLRTGRSLELENSFMIQNILDDLYYDLKEIKYYPFSLDWQGHLKLDVGQWITLKTNKNETFKVPVLSQSFNFKGGLKSKISADSKAGNDTQYSYKGFLGKRIEQMSTEIEAEVQQQLEYKDKEFDEKINKAKSEINDGIEQAQAEAERYADDIKQSINTEIAQVNQSMQAQSEEHDRQVANILSKTQSVESLANQAKSDAASAIARANQVKTEAIADARAQVATVSQALNTAKSELQTAIASADQKARDSQASATALRNDLNLQASKILEQARAQTALTSRVTTVETLADGTRSTVAELSKTVSKATGDITSVTSRTKTVEDTLSQTRTQYEALTQTVNMQTGQIESINRKTADLQSGIDGVTERFESLRIEDNLLLNSSFNQNLNQWQGTGVTIVDGKARIIGELNKTKYIYQSIKSQIANDDVSQVYIASISVKVTNYVAGSINPFLALYISGRKNDSVKTWFGATYLTAARLEAVNNRGVVQFTTTFKVNVPRSQIGSMEFNIYARDFTGEVEFEKVSLRRGNIDLGWQASPEDLRSEIATYKRSAEESSAELSRQIQLADGKAVEAKTYAQQTATAINTRLESLETYKNAEGARVEQYLTASREETARQLTAERTAIATNYVAKSTYDENVRGTTLKLNEIKTTADTAKQNLAVYQNTVDRKLEELTSSTQTLDGKINTASAKVDTVAGQIRTEISEVEGKIPTEIGGKNLLINNKMATYSGHSMSSRTTERLAGRGAWYIEYKVDFKPNTDYTLSCESIVKNNGDFNNLRIRIFDSSVTIKKMNWLDFNGLLNFRTSDNIVSGDKLLIYVSYSNVSDYEIIKLKLEETRVKSAYSPAPEDLIDELSSVKTTITQTASGVEQLSTSLTTTDSKVTTAETKIRQLISDVSSKVSQTDYNTLTGRVDSAETAITQNATEISKRLTSTQVESAITGKGYQTKSQVDDNITGRGYITNSALQPYALSTTVQNLVQETADSFSRTISRVENKIPTKIGVTNLLGGTSSDWKTIRVTQHNGLIKSYNPQEWALLGIKTGDSVTFSVDVKTTSGKKLRSRISFYGANTHYYSEAFVVNGEGRLSVTGVVPDGITSVRLFVDANLTVATNTGVTEESCRREKLEIGAIATDWSPAPEDLATVTALHSVRDTVDSHTRTIGAVGTTGSILDNVSKVTQTAAGLVQEVSGTNGLKTQVSTLAGSYAIKSLTKAGDVLGQINLNKDGSIKIDGSLVQITGKTYIQDGVITSAKIGSLDAGKLTAGYISSNRFQADSITGDKLVMDSAFFNKFAADEAKLKQLFAKNAFITQVQAVNLSAKQIAGGIAKALNGGMDVNFDESKINFYTNVAAIRRIYTGHPTQFIKFETEGNYSRTIIGSNRNGGEVFNSATFAGIVVENTNNINTEDNVRLYGDNTLFRHAQAMSVGISILLLNV